MCRGAVNSDGAVLLTRSPAPRPHVPRHRPDLFVADHGCGFLRPGEKPAAPKARAGRRRGGQPAMLPGLSPASTRRLSPTVPASARRPLAPFPERGHCRTVASVTSHRT